MSLLTLSGATLAKLFDHGVYLPDRVQLMKLRIFNCNINMFVLPGYVIGDVNGKPTQVLKRGRISDFKELPIIRNSEGVNVEVTDKFLKVGFFFI